mmetsp:Transcript_4334/g.5978  ORF Transcript_4334/g.5978 Transcript_4334/m.5978 type:complete len:311 (+) Transcript_4334:64-996(+)|eukprot:CAMPEP_0117755566 /NCGR_PEP_ID=MMETSP0947-20121206/13530_1 /TAXON_ID=44440 /ORGANISM="Chattonella subsalsa, Strain CCMP2191" /LENGTH=310 /DNA_ID=CAMNT_0005574929 /DNA_START=63 /DNA_END=995 /DNA_ORIENTATION=-
MPIFGDENLLIDLGGGILSSRDGIAFKGWQFVANSFPILSESEISDFCSKMASNQGENVEAGSGSVVVSGSHLQLPEILFGNSFMKVWRLEGHFQLRFDALGTLRDWVASHVRDEAQIIKVPEAEIWSTHTADAGFKHEEYDWTFGNRYCGSLEQFIGEWGSQEDGEKVDNEGLISYPQWISTAEGGIQWEMLQTRDPILFYDEVVLFEDYLHDHGYVQSSAKLRVMPKCWFLLLRFWLRVDGILIKVWDVRYFHCFETSEIWREKKYAETSFERLAETGLPLDIQSYQDPNVFYRHLEVKDISNERLEI